MSVRRIVFLFVVLAVFLVPFGLCFEADLDKITYVTNDTLMLIGTTDYDVAVDINARIYDDSDTELNSSDAQGTASGTFSLEISLTDYVEGDYYVVVTQNETDELTLYFHVVAEEINYRIFILSDDAVYVVNTPDSVSTGGALADIYNSSSYSVSRVAKYGNSSIYGDMYYFVLSDPYASGVYSKLFIDNDANFSLYDFNEDLSDGTGTTEKELKRKDIWKNNVTDFMVAGIDSAGSKIVLGKTFSTSVFSAGQTVYYLIVSEDADGNIVGNKTLNIEIVSPADETDIAGTTDADGTYVGNVTLSSIGTYTISVNNGLSVEFIDVESFSISTKTADVSGDPAGSFTPGSIVRISVAARESNEFINLSSLSLDIIYPNGTAISPSMAESSLGNYYYDFVTPSNLEGSYAVKATSEYGGDTQVSMFGFLTESSAFEMFAINTDYLEEVQEGGVMVEAFAPGRNITIMAVQSNLSQGGFMGGEEGGAIAIDNNETNTTCEDVVSVLELRDDKDSVYDISSTLDVKSLDELTQPGEILEDIDPPQGLLSQCMIIITNTTLPDGFYNVKAKLSINGNQKISVASFSIQRLLASSYTVDKNAESFGFFVPNSTVNLKVKLVDMTNDQELNASQIIDAKIVEMHKEWPTYTDVITQISNETFDSELGALSFTSPNSEGFFSLGFRFKANISGTIYEGLGRGFFELKKYIIFAQPSSSGEGMGKSSFSKPGDNITLAVFVVDVDKGSLFDIGFDMNSGSQMSCTGCSGLNARITRIMNYQLFEEIENSAYNATEGSIQNSTSGTSITISDQNFDPGFYGVDIELVNPENESETYFGWGNFEIRSFFVQTAKAFYPFVNESGNFTYFYTEASEESMGGFSEMQFETGQHVYIKADAMIPGMNGASELPIDSAEIVNIVKQSYSGPPTTICRGEDCGAIANRTYLNTEYNCTYNEGQRECSTEVDEAWIANISLPESDKIEQYVVNIRLYSGDNSDIGSVMVTTAAYALDTSYRDSQGWWDPLYSSEELLNVTLTATNFSDGGNRSISNATVDFIFDKKKERPVSINSNIWNGSMSSCSGNVCNVWINLSTFTQGRYALSIGVTDTLGKEQSGDIGFEIKNSLFSVPQILQSWNWQSDSADTGSINLNDQQDRCDNTELDLRGASNNNNLNQELTNNYLYCNFEEGNISLNYNPDACPQENLTVCIGSAPPFNIVDVPDINKTLMNYSSLVLCLNESDGTGVDIANCISGPTPDYTLIGIVTNSTTAWIKYNMTNGTGAYSVAGAVVANNSGDYLSVGSRGWTVKNIKLPVGAGQFEYTDDGLVLFLPSTYLVISNKPDSFALGHFCINGGGINPDPSGSCGGGETDLYVLMNSTHSIIGTSTDLTGSWVEEGIVSNAPGWAIADVGYDSSGVPANKTRVVSESNYRLFVPQDSNGNVTEIIIPEYYPDMWGGIYCVGNDSAQESGPGTIGARRWRNKQNVGADDCGANAERVFVFTNESHIWMSTSNNLSGVSSMTTTVDNVTPEQINGLDWSLSALNITNARQTFGMKLSSGRICGQSWENCQGPGPCQPTIYEVYAPGEYDEFAFGRISLIQSPWMVREMFDGAPYERYVYFFHNKTHLFVTDEGSMDFRGVEGIPTGDNLTDPYGGLWMVKALSDNTVSLKGLNTVAGTGAYVNMSLSLSGTVRLGVLREEELGFFKEGGRAGMDLNDNGFTNDTFYYLLSDANTAGVYDTFFFSNDSTSLNFTSPIYVSDNQSIRNFISNDDVSLTLLSIDPRADRVLFYTSDLGDWSELGDIAVNNNIRIPLIIRKPNGAAIASTLTGIGAYKIDETTGVKSYVSFRNVSVNVNNGLGEVLLNSSEGNTNYTFTSGQYQFEVVGNTSSDQLKLEEWKWPRANLKSFLVTERMGKGGWLSGFFSITRDAYGEMAGSRFLEVWSVDLSNGYSGVGNVSGVVENAWNMNSSDCGFVAPADANPTPAAEVHESQGWNVGNYYFYFSGNNSDSDRVWMKAGDCNFTDAENYTTGQLVNITKDGGIYMLQVLAIGMRNGTNNLNSYALLGINITNTTLMDPVMVDSFDGSGRWKLGAMNISGTVVNALFTNSSVHSMCSVFSGECISAAFMSTDGDYTGMVEEDALVPGSNLTSIGFPDYYISTLGPNGWEGIVVSDGSDIPAGVAKPLFGNLYIRDPTPLKVGFVNESVADIDLNMDDDTEDTFYIVVFDDLQDDLQVLNRIIVDDDNEITPMWQELGQGSTTYYDYSDVEAGEIVEQWGGLPSAIWTGNVNFGPEEENRDNQTYRDIPWDQKPSWGILVFNNTDMLLSKDRWCGIGENETIKLIVRAYHFNQSNIEGANVSISKIYEFGFMGGGIYNSTYYDVDASLTGSSGYAVLSISPANGSSWDTNNGLGGNYIFRILVDDTGDTTMSERYTMIGGECQ